MTPKDLPELPHPVAHIELGDDSEDVYTAEQFRAGQLAAYELGARSTVDMGSLAEQASSWSAVWGLLRERDPDLTKRASTGLDCALASIRKMTAARSTAAQPADPSLVQEFRATGLTGPEAVAAARGLAGLQASAARAAAQPVEPLTPDVVEQRLLTWRQSHMNKSGDRLALDDFMDKESLDDLIDFVCAAPPAASGDSTPPSAPVQGDSTERSGYRPEAAGQDPKPATPEPAWKAEKAEIDAMDDGYGPYLEWTLQDARVGAWKKRQWERFKCWAEDFMGQGYSLACFEGAILDSTTSWTFRGYLAGVNAAQLPESPQAASGCSHTAGPDDQSKVDDQEPTAGSSHG